MTDPDIIAQAEAWCNATVTASLETEPELCLDGARLLPQLLAEAKRMQNEIEMYKMGEEAANKLILQGRAAEADRDAWKAKAIKYKAEHELLFLECWDDEDRKAAYLKAARELEEEMKQNERIC